jgi:hypothetical protein
MRECDILDELERIDVTIGETGKNKLKRNAKKNSKCRIGRIKCSFDC